MKSAMSSLEADLLPFLSARYAGGKPTITAGAQLRFGHNLNFNYSSLNSIEQRQIGYNVNTKPSFYGFVGAHIEHDLSEPYSENAFYQQIGLDEAFAAVYSQTRMALSGGVGFNLNNVDVAARGEYIIPQGLDKDLHEYRIGLKASVKF